MGEPSKEAWSSLYAAAEEFRQLAPWRWLMNEDLIGIEDPTTGLVGYGSVLGNGGEEFGLTLFLGGEGFAGYRHMFTTDIDAEPLEITARQRALTLMFVDREVLRARDREVIKSLGLHFRGRGAWPWLFSQQPGYVPWYLDAQEAAFLELALRQAMEVAPHVRSGELRLTWGLDGRPVLVRCLRNGTWVDEWRQPEAWSEASPEQAVDANRLAPLKQAKRRGREAWIADLFLLPTPIGDRGARPHYPKALLVAEERGFVLTVHLFEPGATAAAQQAELLKLFEQVPQLPREIVVVREDAERLIRPIAEPLGIAVQPADVPELDALKEELFARFM